MRPARWVPRLVVVGWLTLAWVLLWGAPTAGNLVGGVLAASAVVAAFPLRSHDPGTRFRLRPLPALAFAGWFAVALVRSCLSVAREVVVAPSRSRIRTAVVAAPLRTRSERLAAMVANTITLTPGTLTLDARGTPSTLYVHVISLADADAARREVAEIERRIVCAFGSPAEVEAVCGGRPPRRSGPGRRGPRKARGPAGADGEPGGAR